MYTNNVAQIILDWAGILVERVTTTRLDEYMQRYIFEPLGIKDMSGFPDHDMQPRLIAWSNDVLMVIWWRGIMHGSMHSTHKTLASPMLFVVEVLVFR